MQTAVSHELHPSNGKDAAFGGSFTRITFVTTARGVRNPLHGRGIEEGKGLEVRIRHMGA
jgi:hypothetical protein